VHAQSRVEVDEAARLLQAVGLFGARGYLLETAGGETTQTVNVTYGQMTVLRVAMPTGRISVNASPWAEVVIDGAVVGETPIANYSLPVGSHQIVFRHPELGERRQTVVVKVGEYVRVTQAFDRSPEQK